jgi:hypothetical protein
VDEQVRQAMARWPGVPDMYGWLRLDRRGNWLLIDRGRPDVDEALHGAGSPITRPAILDFIGRNYQPDARGCWYWQNGPQRVFVDLDLAPLVLRVMAAGERRRLVTHTGFAVARIDAVQASPAGDLFIATEHGPGVVHDMDLTQLDPQFDQQDAIAAILLNGLWYPVTAADGRTGGFVSRPMK